MKQTEPRTSGLELNFSSKIRKYYPPSCLWSTIILSLFQAPVEVIKCLDKLICDFFWEGSHGDGGMHNVNWEVTQCPKLMVVLVLEISLTKFCPYGQMDLAVFT